jgi:hypothetical protein
MTHEFVIKNCTLENFSNMFKTKADYKEALRGVEPTKNRVHPPTNALEENLQNNIIDNKKIKLGSSLVRVTSYLLENDQYKRVVYISKGGRYRFRFLLPGRKKDRGGYFEATQIGSDLKVKAKTAIEYHSKLYAGIIILGLLGFFMPGLLFAVAFFFGHRILSKNIKKIIAPALIQTFES